MDERRVHSFAQLVLPMSRVPEHILKRVLHLFFFIRQRPSHRLVKVSQYFILADLLAGSPRELSQEKRLPLHPSFLIPLTQIS